MCRLGIKHAQRRDDNAVKTLFGMTKVQFDRLLVIANRIHLTLLALSVLALVASFVVPGGAEWRFQCFLAALVFLGLTFNTGMLRRVVLQYF
ncbi:hypothetical protein CCP1ISM_3370001 [Azospirillaceae bacterium]